jgi:hypothetical protein
MVARLGPDWRGASSEAKEAARGHRGPAAFDRLSRNARHVDVFRDTGTGRIRMRIENARGEVRYVNVRDEKRAAGMTRTAEAKDYAAWKRRARGVAPDVAYRDTNPKRRKDR